jgi:hypothetical protein
MLLFFLLFAFLASIFAESLNEFSSRFVKVKAIVNHAQSGNVSAEGGLRLKCDYLDKALQDRWRFDNSQIAVYSLLSLGSGSPKETRLPTKSDRAPPEASLS